MRAAFVIDCSIAMTWCFPDEATDQSAAILDRLESETALVPTLWFLEVASVLAMAERRKRITAAESTEFLALITSLDLEVDDEATRRVFDHLLPLCRRHRLTSYDAAYLDLAGRRKLPLATLDAALRAGGKAMGIRLLGK